MSVNRMFTSSITAFAIVLVPCTQALAATSGTSDVVLQAAATVEINIVDASITLTPGQGDYETTYISAEAAAGIDLRIRTNSSTGAVLSVKCTDASPQIALTDLLFKTQTAAGGSGTTQSTYGAITAVDQTLWTTTTTSATWTTVQTDIRVQDLWDYSDASGGGTTAYTNTLTYTIAVQ
ncbi:MAG: hypothetical protein KAW17_11735 [Candidatus Eisenbacteria sp.]|nr:hypothetical protein [Candidatus Eisenbacteria bacterium]